MAQTFFYSQQCRRFLLQIQRLFSNFQVEYGKDKDGITRLQTVPVKYGDASRIASQIMRENSENKIIPTPMISFYITNIEYMREWVQDPHHISKINIRQRNYDENNGELTTTQGNAFTVERIMPVPHKMTINVDIWTSNTEQKFQLFEQLAWIFNPSLEIQSTDNFIDWTSLSKLERVGLTWSNRSVPQGVDDNIDIMTMAFELPFWITPPAKIKKLGVVKTIVSSIFDESGSISDGVIDNDLLMGTRVKTTWMNYGILLLNNEVQLLEHYQSATGQDDEFTVPEKIGTDTRTWKAFLNAYGSFQNGVSQLRVSLSETSDLIGTVSYHPSNDYKLLFNVDSDTVPTNTLTAITAIIDPLRSGPGAGLPTPIHGQRYLLTQDVGNLTDLDSPDAWKGNTGDSTLDWLVASANDIIEYDGVKWVVSFDASTKTSSISYVTNTTTGIQYKWDGSQWRKSWEGVYRHGEWAIVI